MTGNDVEYTYGTSGNETGRLVHIVDGSGSYECLYDALGNVTEDIRTIALPGSDDVYRFKTKYTYDSWGRMDSMAYPDGEVVSYKYIWGGDLFAMDGNKDGTLQSYIRGIHYNKFGQRDSVQYGNGTRAHYTYDALHRLSRLTSFQIGGAVMQDIKYTFDSVSNIKRIKNSVLAIGTLGGGYDNTFEYDGLHRLGGSQGHNTLGHYRYTMDYTPSGRITDKHLETPSGSLTGPADMFYGYCNDQKPHTVRRIYDEKNEKLFDLRWDDAGNLGQISIGNGDANFETGRFLFWTEDCYGCEHRLCQSNEVSNRMHAAVDEKYSSYYVYDHSGERRVKLTGTNDLLDVNADYMYTASVLREPTIYPSAYMVMSNRGYTNVAEVESRASSLVLPRCSNVTERKHYYAGTERVAARIGGGGLNAIDQEHGLSDKSGSVFKQSLEQINDRILEKNDIECIANGLSSNDKLTIDMNEVPERLQAELITDYDEFRQMIADAQSIHHNEPDVYFYHSDHLGSASWITDNGGLAVQHLQYLPYGEPYVNQRISGYSERFTFTGKERDEETGYGYFGARYMDHELMTMWLSVDPMADKYPSISPYAYCAWNPIKLVDPNGEENIIYIVNLQKDKQPSIDVNKLIKEANQRFENLGLETRVMLAPDGRNFDPQYMDKTDSYAVIGSAFEVKNFISAKSGSETINSWKGGTSNPERSENNYTKKGNYIAIDASGLKSAAYNLGFDKFEMAALTILHGAGHNAGFNHSDDISWSRRFDQNTDNASIMSSGNWLKYEKNKGLNYIMSPERNSKYVERMKSVFGTNKAHSNYDNNKIKKQARYIVY